MTLVSVRPKVRVSFAVPPITFVISAAQCRFLAARRVLRSATRGELLVPRARLAIIPIKGGASIAVVLSVACSKFFFYYFFVISILVILFSVRHLRTLVRSFCSYLKLI